jgi:hypothetical protein
MYGTVQHEYDVQYGTGRLYVLYVYLCLLPVVASTLLGLSDALRTCSVDMVQSTVHTLY